MLKSKRIIGERDIRHYGNRMVLTGFIFGIILTMTVTWFLLHQQQWTADVAACMKFLGVELSYCQRIADILQAGGGQ